MAVLIQEECVSCALCLAPCPENCIVEEEDQFVIDLEHCTQCEDCVSACPIDCIVVQ